MNIEKYGLMIGCVWLRRAGWCVQMETYECGDGVDGEACIVFIHYGCLQCVACGSSRLLLGAASEQHRKFAFLNNAIESLLLKWSILRCYIICQWQLRLIGIQTWRCRSGSSRLFVSQNATKVCPLKYID